VWIRTFAACATIFADRDRPCSTAWIAGPDSNGARPVPGARLGPEPYGLFATVRITCAEDAGVALWSDDGWVVVDLELPGENIQCGGSSGRVEDCSDAERRNVRLSEGNYGDNRIAKAVLTHGDGAAGHGCLRGFAYWV